MYQNWKKKQNKTKTQKSKYSGRILLFPNNANEEYVHFHRDFFFFKGRLRGAEGKCIDLCICSGVCAFGFSFFFF